MPKSGSHEMKLEDFVAVMREMMNAGIKEVRFSGGEPLLNENLLEMVEWVDNNTALEVGIATNGSLLNVENLTRLGATRAELTIHLPSLDPNVYHSLTGGCMDRLLTNISLTRSHAIPYSFNFVAHEESILQLPSILEEIVRHEERLKILPYLDRKQGSVTFPMLTFIRRLLELHKFYPREIDERGIEEFTHISGAKANLLHSPCHDFNLRRCTAYGEARVDASMQVKNCIFGKKSYPLWPDSPDSINAAFRQAIFEMTCGNLRLQ